MGFCGRLWVCSLLAVSLLSTAHASPPSADDVKAALLYNFLKFVEISPITLPPTSDTIRVCIAGGAQSFHKSAAVIRGRKVQNRNVEIRLVESPTAVAGCHVTYLGSELDNELSQYLHALEREGSFTVGDAEGFAARGVVLNFVLVDGKVRFEVNAEAAERNRLTLSSRLLKLAIIVRPEVP